MPNLSKAQAEIILKMEYCTPFVQIAKNLYGQDKVLELPNLTFNLREGKIKLEEKKNDRQT